MSFLNSYLHLGNNENDILIGQSEEVHSTPLWVAMICFADAMNIFSEVIGENWNEVIDKAEISAFVEDLGKGVYGIQGMGVDDNR